MTNAAGVSSKYKSGIFTYRISAPYSEEHKARLAYGYVSAGTGCCAAAIKKKNLILDG